METDRLYLRPMGPADAEFLLEHFSDPEINRYLVDAEPLATPADAAKIISFYQQPDDGQCRWILIDKQSRSAIGTCGFHLCEPSYHKSEIGFDLAREYWGQGLMKEAVDRILLHGFTTLEMNRVEALTHPDNRQSISLLEKLGFQHEGTIRDRFFFRDRYYDHESFSLLRREWQAPAARD
jgi:ribosomal-protein-alanine N-acetyltransferase